MAKRIADKELTDRNWDLEEEGEEVGSRRRIVVLYVKATLLTCDWLFSTRPGRFLLRVRMC